MRTRSIVVAVLSVTAAGLVALLLHNLRSPAAGPVAVAPAAPAHVRPSSADVGSRMPSRSRPELPPPPGPRDGQPTFTPPVRDHRPGGRGGEVPVTRLPSPPARVAHSIIGSIRAGLRPVVERCETAASLTVRGDSPLLQVELVVSIAGGIVTIDELEAQVRDVEAPGLISCVLAGRRQIAVAAPEHADVDRHPLTFPFRLGRTR